MKPLGPTDRLGMLSLVADAREKVGESRTHSESGDVREALAALQESICALADLARLLVEKCP